MSQTTVAVWLMDGASIRAGQVTVLAGEFEELFVGQFDAAAGAEAIMRKKGGADAGAVYAARLVAGSVTTPVRVTGVGGAVEVPVGSDYRISGAADMTGDGILDLIWRGNDGALAYWEMSGLGIRSKGLLWSCVDAYWTIAGFPDFDGDGKSGMFFRGANGETWHWQISGWVIMDSRPLNTVPTSWKTLESRH
jgi:hypothetical protein